MLDITRAEENYTILLVCMLLLSVVVFVVLLFISAPYGRHARTGWGPSVPPRIAWFFMELPAVLVVPGVVITEGVFTVTSLGLLALWEIHYVYRALIYPFQLAGRPMPVSVLLMGFTFNAVNGWLIGTGIVLAAPVLVLAVPGLLLFALGMWVTRRADAILRRLRQETEGYGVPAGFLYRYVSCPNYLGEIVQWLGFALVAQTGAALVFVAWSVANLLPRALQHHAWYRETFADYPSDRKAIIPGVL